MVADDRARRENAVHRMEFQPEMIGALADVRVLDLSRLVAGNMLTSQLGDFGADVIKVEPPKGDPLRAWRDDGAELYWKEYCRNKRSIGVDLRTEGAIELVLRLASACDVFVEGFKPGTLEAMGLGPERLWQDNPNLVVVRISGFGQSGPYSHLPGFGSLIEAMSGLADRTGFADREPVLPPFPVADMVAGLQGALATLVALHARSSGRTSGQVVDVSLLEPLFGTLGPEVAIYQRTGTLKERSGSASNTTSPRNVYRCNDGRYVALSGSIQSMAVRIFEAIGRPDMISDPRFADNAARLQHRQEVDEAISEWFGRHTAEVALEIMRNAGATVGPVYSAADVSTDPHFIEREILVEIADPEVGSMTTHNVSARLSKTPGGFRRPAPRFNQDRDEILSDFGFRPDEILGLLEAGVLVP